MKTFNHAFVELPSLVRNDGETRTYTTPTGQKYPSVTTVLSKTADKTFLHEWRNRVGHEEAAKITRRAANRGTAVHKMCETYVLNEDLRALDVSHYDKFLFNQIQPVLTNCVDNIRVSEGALFSHNLRVAGSVDLVCDFNGQPAVVDFKTSLRPKKLEWIHDYMIQASMYSYMFWEMVGVLCPNIVVIIAVESESTPQVFCERTVNWLHYGKARCEQYHSLIAG